MKRTAWILVSLCVLSLAGWAYVWFYGSVIVYDDTGRVASAVITNDDTEWPLFRLPGNVFFRVPPRGDGEIEVRCQDGSSARGEYVSHQMHVSVRVVEDAACQLGSATYR